MVESRRASGAPFVLVRLQACKPPEFSKGANWHHYVITQDGNRVEGYRQGPTALVIEAVESMVEKMNERRQGKFSAVRSKPGPKAKGATVDKSI